MEQWKKHSANSSLRHACGAVVLVRELCRRPSTRVRYRSPCRLWYPRTSCTSTLNGLTIPRQSCPPVLPWLPGVFSTPAAGRPLLRPRAPGAAPTRPDLRVGASSKRRRVCLGAAHPAVHGTVRMDRGFFSTNVPTRGRVGAFAGGAEHTLSAASPRVVTQPPPRAAPRVGCGDLQLERVFLVFKSHREA